MFISKHLLAHTLMSLKKQRKKKKKIRKTATQTCRVWKERPSSPGLAVPASASRGRCHPAVVLSTLGESSGVVGRMPCAGLWRAPPASALNT